MFYTQTIDTSQATLPFSALKITWNRMSLITGTVFIIQALALLSQSSCVGVSGKPKNTIFMRTSG